MHLVQLRHPQVGRRVAIVEEPRLALLDATDSIYSLAQAAIASKKTVAELAAARRSNETVDYDAVYRGTSDWKLLPAFDHPTDPMHCLVTGTGLTHKASAQNREKMHQAQAAGKLSDSMRMYQLGVDGGRPTAGQIGVQPEWFYKGTGLVLKAHGEPLQQPSFADDAGEEPEVAGAYIIDDEGTPWRIGFAAGNEFADHVMEKKNYLYLAHSKLRECAVGPELSLDETFQDARHGYRPPRWRGLVDESDSIGRNPHGPLARQFGIPPLQICRTSPGRPGACSFLGAAAFSFGAGVALHGGDAMEITWNGLGRPLVNPLHDDETHEVYVAVSAFERT